MALVLLIVAVLVFLAADGVFEPYIHVTCPDFGSSLNDVCGKGNK